MHSRMHMQCQQYFANRLVLPTPHGTRPFSLPGAGSASGDGVIGGGGASGDGVIGDGGASGDGVIGGGGASGDGVIGGGGESGDGVIGGCVGGASVAAGGTSGTLPAESHVIETVSKNHCVSRLQ